MFDCCINVSMRLGVGFLPALILMFFTHTLSAANIYVSPRGSGSGTAESPCSLGKASKIAVAGDVIMLADGKYSMIAPRQNGQKGKMITYKSINRHGAVIENIETGIELSRRSYIAIDGIKVLRVGRFIIGSESSHITIQNCYFDGSSAWESSRFRSTGDGIRIVDNVFKNGTDLLTIGPGDGHLIEGNLFDTAEHTTLVLLGCQKTIVRNNKFINHKQKLMEVFSSRHKNRGRPSLHVLIEGNLFDYTVTIPPRSRKGSASGIQFAGAETIVRRNVFQHQQSSFLWSYSKSADQESKKSYSNRIYNNIFFENGRPGGWRYNGPGMIVPSSASTSLFRDNIVANNIFFANRFYDSPRNYVNGLPQTTQIIVSGKEPVDMQFFGNSFMCKGPNELVIGLRETRKGYTVKGIADRFPGYFRDNIQVDPMFVNAKRNGNPARGPSAIGSVMADFMLKKNSKCIDSGQSLTQTRGAGKGDTIPLHDVIFFCDGYDLIKGDVIRIGEDVVTIEKINYQKRTIIVDRSISWKSGVNVSLNYLGRAPDIGVFEYDNQQEKVDESFNQEAGTEINISEEVISEWDTKLFAQLTQLLAKGKHPRFKFMKKKFVIDEFIEGKSLKIDLGSQHLSFPTDRLKLRDKAELAIGMSKYGGEDKWLLVAFYFMADKHKVKARRYLRRLNDAQRELILEVFNN